jgi:molybdate/tungstate transport system substrate-binding protein
LSTAFTQVETAFQTQTGIPIADNNFTNCATCNSASAGSLDLARHIAAGDVTADIYATADYQDIEALKPTYVPYDIVFAESRMVLTYAAPATTATGTKTTGSKNYASVIGSSSTTCSLSAIPTVAPSWYSVLTASGVKISGSDPNLDPSGYRSFYLIPELAQNFYGSGTVTAAAFQNNYYLSLASDVTGPTDPKVKNTLASTTVIGQGYDYGFSYESSAKSTVAAGTTPGYCYAYLPTQVGMGDATQAATYSTVSFTSATPVGAAKVTIPGSRTKWGVTIPKNAPDSANAVAFLQFLLGPQGQSILTSVGPPPISETSPAAVVFPSDYSALPSALQPLVSQANPNTF